MALWAVVCLAGALFPLTGLGGPFILTLLTKAFIAAILAVSLDLLLGQSGLLSFGHACWYGVGAYSGALCSIYVSTDLLVASGIAVLVSGSIALITGIVITRLSGVAFAIFTMALAQVLYGLVFVFPEITKADDGLNGIALPTILGHSIHLGNQYYWLALVVLLLVIFLAKYLVRTPMGATWAAIRENEERARFIGIRVQYQKTVLFVISAMLASLAGTLLVFLNGAVSPELMHWSYSGEILMYVILGGVGTIIGPVFGAIGFTFAIYYISSWTSSWPIYFGALFMLVIVLFPRGLATLFTRRATPK